GEVFAFHDDVLPEFRDRTIIHTYARFGAGQGFRSSGKLYGDGVCHLASLITWTARDAGLKVTTLVNHDFANIPEIPREQGTSIVTTGSPSLNAQRQNLYVENTLDVPVTFVFDYSDKVLHLSIYK
ncbi:MAG TPA: VanW family protein, partial [Patescibacteria group bacterium]|nr:VanW family protein [Patescibacteria group bacterium]